MARLLKFLVTLVALLVTTAASFAQTGQKNRITQEIDGSQMTRLRGNVHPLLQFGVDQGRISGATRMGGVSLIFGPSPSQKAALEALIAQQQDPASPNYHKWLTPEEYADRFSMSSDDISKVTAWLKSQGFTVDEVSRSRNRVSFSGTAGQVGSVFHTEFHQYLVDGEKHLANATELSVPAAIAPMVAGFRNLDDFRLKPRSVSRRFTFNDPAGSTFLAPADVATIYHLDQVYAAGFDGTGQTIAVVGQTAIDVNDISRFRSAAGLPAKVPQLLLIPGGSSITVRGDEVEADLDVEWSGAVAKNATIIYVYTDQSNTANGGGVIHALDYAIQNNIAPVISISYGGCEALNSGFIAFLQVDVPQGNAQGQTVIAASGDEGATDCEVRNARIATHGIGVDVPAVLAEVTGIGGTTFTGDANHDPAFWNPGNDPLTGGSAKSYIPETVWNDSDATGISSGGGGVSTVILKPAYQTALTPADGHRDVPDISLSASPNHDPYLMCSANSGGTCVTGFQTSNGSVFLVGGTSVGAPVFAGMLTLINQATEQSNGQGNVNSKLYILAASAPTAFHDITTGNNKQTCQGGSTGCTSANSHVVIADKQSSFPTYAGIALLPLVAVLVSLRRRRWVAILGMLLVVSALSSQIACGGGSSAPPPPPPPPPNISIGWSAGPGYDLATGLGSVSADLLASNWPGYTTAPAFDITSAPGSINATTIAPGTSTLTVSRTNGGFAGAVNLTCVAVPVNATCIVNPNLVNLGSSGTTALSVSAGTTGAYTVRVTGTSGAISHSVVVPVTVN